MSADPSLSLARSMSTVFLSICIGPQHCFLLNLQYMITLVAQGVVKQKQRRSISWKKTQLHRNYSFAAQLIFPMAVGAACCACPVI